ncbi:hypothetical protein POM88_006900 [Heracleum sosnowskyi]|uniref:Uncharacterized protein n=1 Tax=Heracleum sosnowskyi TaxID=360622 RepID=A0AAD8N5R4_9APIA|nr:hypothetical protein POM88_006900 [Heracleum sosnowskyi]
MSSPDALTSLSSSIVLFSLLHSRLHSSRFKVIKMTSQNDEISEPIANEAPDDVPIAEPDVTADKEPAEPPTQAQIQSQESRGVRGDTIASAEGMDMYAILEEERSKQWEMDMIAENSDENRSELELFMLDRIEAQTKDFDILLWWKAPEEPIHLRDMLVELEKYEEIAQDLDAAMELDGNHDNSD